jgi:hypothetical protein
VGLWPPAPVGRLFFENTAAAELQSTRNGSATGAFVSVKDRFVISQHEPERE